MKRACDQEGPSAGKRAALTVRLNVGGRYFDTTRETLSSCPFFEHCLAERGCQMAEDDDGRIFLDRDGDLFRILLQAIRTGARFHFVCPKGAETRHQVAAFRDWMLREIEKTLALADSFELIELPAP